MKILYFGTICNMHDYEKNLCKFRVKPSKAPMVFEHALLQGFKDNKSELDVYSFPIIPAFPKSSILGWNKKQEILESGYSNTWLSVINITGLKQKTLELSSRKVIKEWVKKNKNEEVAILIYSIYEPISKSIVKLSKKYNIPCFAIVPDLPRDMYNVSQINPIKKWLSKIYVKNAQKIQGEFNGYIYLTERMPEEINPKAPYVIVEGIADISNVNNCKEAQNKKAVMYAGALNRVYGLLNLIDAFMALDEDDLELWLFGSGDCVEEIEKKSKIDKRIKYFGSKTHDEILAYEKKAYLLVNVRDSKDEFTKYSFPSKTIEYMLSGTPVLTTKLSGIPKEYYDYVFSIDDNKPDTIQRMFLQILGKSDDELVSFGKRAQEYIKKYKNGRVQTKKIIDFMQFFYRKGK